MSTAMTRSVTSNVFDPGELGPVFVVYGSPETLIPLFLLGIAVFDFNLCHPLSSGLVVQGKTFTFTLAAINEMYTDIT